ncbi:hypothetical protein ISN39_30480 (plasmid) [Rhizobium sp. 007]|nr:hypothetical protein ISN39_30480 [Rhizobium sp. 007]
MFVVKGDPMKALAGFKLPEGAEVAVVSSRPETTQKISETLGKRVKSAAQVVTSGSPAGKKAVINQAAFEPDARSLALVEGVRIAQKDLEEAGGAYDLDQVRTLMQGVSRQAVDKRVNDGSLLAVPGPSNRRAYPTLQFNRDGSIVSGLKEVRQALPTKNAWVILNFLARPDARLGGRKPIDVLKIGDIPLVVEAARRYGE